MSLKTKDNDKQRMDLSLYCRLRDLELKSHPNGKMLKPKANYTLATKEIKHVCQWLKDLRMSDGYSSNLARCVDVNKGRVFGMKSHDCHVLHTDLSVCNYIRILDPYVRITYDNFTYGFLSVCNSYVTLSYIRILCVTYGF